MDFQGEMGEGYYAQGGGGGMMAPGDVPGTSGGMPGWLKVLLGVTGGLVVLGGGMMVALGGSKKKDEA